MYQLILIGTGFASSFFLYKYLQSASPLAKILVLEAGDKWPHLQRLKAARKEISPILDPPIPEQLIQNQSPEKPWLFNRALGGTNAWWGCTPRFAPPDFQLQTLYQQAQDWPFPYEELMPFYDEAEELMQISGPDSHYYPKQKPYPLPAHSLSTVDQILQNHYPNQYFAQATARASLASSRSSCCNSAVCSLCPVDAKFTIENGMMSVYEDERVELQSRSQVYQLWMEGGKAKGVMYRQGNRMEKAEGEAVVLGANALFNPHILLASGDENPHTGAGLCEQVSVGAKLMLNGLENRGGGTVISANGYMWYENEREKRAACLIESWNSPYMMRAERGKWREVAHFKFIFEDIPQAKNRVLLSDDPLKPKVVYQGYSDYTQEGINYLHQHIEDLFACLPVESLEVSQQANTTEGHILGTTRMGESAEDSVIDANGRHHQWRNVWVLGGSMFPSISPSNPTLTICALALRAAEKLLTQSESPAQAKFDQSQS